MGEREREEGRARMERVRKEMMEDAELGASSQWRKVCALYRFVWGVFVVVVVLSLL